MDQAQEQSPSIRDRIGSLLASQEQPQEPQEAPQEAPQEEVVEATPQEPEKPQEVVETDPTANWETVEMDGETLQVPPKFAKAFMQERDYTQKRQADADYRKVVESRERALNTREQSMAQLAPLYIQAHAMEQAVQQYQRLDWNAIQDPAELLNRKTDYALLLQQRQDLHRQIEGATQRFQQESHQALVKTAEAAAPVIKRAIPDWSAEKDATLTKFALDHGASAEELMGLASRPWAVVLLEKARKFDELQAQRAQLPRKANPSPVAKPGAKPSAQSSEQALYRKNLEQFRKSGGKDAGALRSVIKAKLARLGS
jgi:hypothetical protein